MQFLTSVPGPHVPVAEAFVAGATAVNYGSSVIEQVTRPNLGKAGVDTAISIISEGAGRIPMYGPLLSPVTNEIGEAFKDSNASKEMQQWLNERGKR